MKNAKRIAFCGVMTALAAVVLTVGALSGVGNYAGAMLAGLCLLPAGWEWGKKTELVLWISVSLVGAMVIPDPETVLLFAAFFGWYPVFRDSLDRLPLLLRLFLKLLVFNLAAVGCEILVMKVLAPETEETWIILVLLACGNLAFLLYDVILPRLALLYRVRLRKILFGERKPRA
ncbi:MAG: hypothetical protein IJM21_07310 [Clostridia bacterium]|nr:hypothetical protein [Clostridia bacterium]